MKVILFGTDLNDIKVYPDSAVGRDAMPLFLPDGQWSGTLSLAFRIGRLGKNVREKFALRYVDGISVALTLDCPAPWITIMDNAVTPGHFLPFEVEIPLTLEYKITPLSSSSDQAAFDKVEIDPILIKTQAERAISLLTSVATIKTGDIILCPIDIPPLSLIPNTRLQLTLSGQPIMNLKIK